MHMATRFSSEDALQPRRLQNTTADAPATVGEYIAAIVVKEIWAGQLLGSSGKYVEPQVSKDYVASMSTTLSNDILDAVRGWIPVADELSPMTLLPDLDEFPTSVSDEDGISLVQRRLLLEALKIIFDVFNEQGARSFGNTQEPMLPRPSVANVSVQIAAMLEHLSLVRPRGAEVHLQQNDLDLDAWQSVCSHVNGRSQPGSKRELIEELQSCRRQIFDLEKELVTQGKITDASANREKREAEKAVQRLIIVNQALEEKLKSRTEEHRNSTQCITELERRIAHEQTLVQDKGKKIEMLENELARTARMQDDLLMRERKYGERILELRMQEFQSICRDSQRKKRLDNAIRGESRVDLEMEVVSEKDLVKLAEETLQQVQHEFNEYFEDRQKAMLNMVHQCEAQMNNDRQRFNEATEREWERRTSCNREDHLLSPNCRLTKRSSTRQLSKQMQSVEVQTDPVPPSLLNGDQALDEAGDNKGRSKTRGSVCMADMSRGKKPSVLLQAEIGLRQTTRQSIHLATPLRRPSLIPSLTATSMDEENEANSVDASAHMAPVLFFSEGHNRRDILHEMPPMLNDDRDRKETSSETASLRYQSETSPRYQSLATGDGITHQVSEPLAENEQNESYVPLPPVDSVTTSNTRGKNGRDGTKSAQFEALRATTPSTRASSRVESRSDSRTSPAPRTSSSEKARRKSQTPEPLPTQRPWKGTQRKTSARAVLSFDRTA